MTPNYRSDPERRRRQLPAPAPGYHDTPTTIPPGYGTTSRASSSHQRNMERNMSTFPRHNQRSVQRKKFRILR